LDKDRVQEYRGQKNKLHQKLYHMEAARGDWRRKPGKVNLSKNVLVCGESLGARVKARRKVGPKHRSRKIEQDKRHSVRSNLGHFSKNEHVHKGRDKGLRQIPQGAKDCLLVLRDKVALYEHLYKEAVGPHIL